MILLLLPVYLLCPQVALGQFLENIMQLGLTNTIAQVLQSEKPTDNAIYDFIVVGGGSAGCALANRLSENPDWTVYLIEAGGVENILNRVPLMATYLASTSNNWGYRSVPQENACFGMRNQECALPRGKVLGGTSSINYMIYNRGNRRDFDRWAAAGNPGWSYDEVLPYFLKSEGASLAGLEQSPYHNRSGPLSVEDVKFRTQLVHAFVRGAQEAGLRSVDYNGESQMGVSYTQATTEGGSRESAYSAFIRPLLAKRRNLRILTFARVTRVLIDPETRMAYGVELIQKRRQYTLRARREVVLAAGAFNSPQLLMLSGVGPGDHLRSLGLPVIQELPVGQTLYDHMSHFGPTFVTNTTRQTLFTTRMTPLTVLAYGLGRDDTALSAVGTEALAFLKVPGSRDPADMPDIELVFMPGSMASDGGTGLKEGANFKDEVYDRVYRPLSRAQQDHFNFLVMQFRPRSAGHLRLSSSNPLDWPIIDPKYFSDPHDIEELLLGIKEAIRITQTPAMQRIGARLHDIPVPGCEHLAFASDDYWRCSIRTMSYTVHHQVAACRMGPASDPTTVVDAQLKVHGIGKLRVVDTSVIPFPPTSHTNAMAIMIGEKAADMIRGEWN